MTAEEYLKACEELEKRKLMLKYEYIESNTTIKPKTLVVVDGEIKWLQKYRVVQHHIHPIIYDVKDNYSPYVCRTYVPAAYNGAPAAYRPGKRDNESEIDWPG